MPVRIRKLIGTIALLALITAWALLAMGFGAMILPSANGVVAFAYYAIVGMGWVLPALPLVTWMSRPDPGGG